MCNDIDECGDNSDETDSVCGDYTCMPDEVKQFLVEFYTSRFLC